MNLFYVVAPVIQAAVTRVKRNTLRHQLLGFTETMLDDIGVSRELLEKGVRAYPWRLDGLEHMPLALAYKSVTKQDDTAQQLVLQAAQYAQAYGVTSSDAVNDVAGDVAKAYARSFAKAA